MTRYRRKVAETVDASPEENFGLPGYAYTNRDGADVWRRKEAFEREYEPVPSGVCSFGHASQAECEASDAREASLKLADELAKTLERALPYRLVQAALSAYLESRKEGR